MYSYKNINDKPNPNICDLQKKLDEILEKYLYKYIESYQGTPLKTPNH